MNQTCHLLLLEVLLTCPLATEMGRVRPVNDVHSQHRGCNYVKLKDEVGIGDYNFLIVGKKIR